MRKKFVIIGVVCVLSSAAFLAGVAIFILKARKAATTQSQSVRAPAAAAPSPSNAPFASVHESDIPGRYMMYGNEEYPLTFYADHSFLNKDGKIYPQHRWYLTPEALVIDWGPNQHRYDRVEGPGIYSCPKKHWRQTPVGKTTRGSE